MDFLFLESMIVNGPNESVSIRSLASLETGERLKWLRLISCIVQHAAHIECGWEICKSVACRRPESTLGATKARLSPSGHQFGLVMLAGWLAGLLAGFSTSGGTLPLDWPKDSGGRRVFLWCGQVVAKIVCWDLVGQGKPWCVVGGGSGVTGCHRQTLAGTMSWL